MDFWKFGTFMLIIGLLRYLFFAGIAFYIFYKIYDKAWRKYKIQLKLPATSDYYREIGYSLLTATIFAIVGILIFRTPLRNYTQLYRNIGDWGWWYWALSIILMLIIHDTYFYWTHRAMHHPRLFKTFHRIHHKSTNPSPWAAFAFHPLESIVEVGVIIPIVILIPIHWTALVVWLNLMMLYNVYGHLGYELYPKNFGKHPIGKWMNTSVNHNMHHKYFKGNYGLYFRFWDEWMGTTHPKYEQKYEEVVTRKQKEMLQ